jgi:hypothetical protein
MRWSGAWILSSYCTLNNSKKHSKFGIYRRPLNLQISKFSFSHSESEFVWKVPVGLKILKFWIRSYLLTAKVLYKSAINCVPWWNLMKKLNKIVRPWFEILFKKTHPRINLTTLFLTKIYLLNTIKPFLSH